MIDRTTQLLFGEFPRDVGNPQRRVIYDLRQLENFIARNNGINDCYVGVYPNLLRVAEIFYDYDGKDSLEETKKLYTFLRERSYPVVPVDSGKKGYHLHQIVRCDGGTKEQLTEATYSVLGATFGTKPPSVDSNPIGDLRRLCRIPNTLRPPENLNYCTYLPPDFTKMNEKEVAEHIKSPHDFDYDLRNPPTLSELCEEFGGKNSYVQPRPEWESRPQGERIDWIIERYVPKLNERCGYWMGRCPFHPDEHPSFAVYPDHFYCFGCGVHGDIIDFINLMRRKGGSKGG